MWVIVVISQVVVKGQHVVGHDVLGCKQCCGLCAAVIKSFTGWMVSYPGGNSHFPACRVVTAHWAASSLWQWAFKPNTTCLVLSAFTGTVHNQHDLWEQNMGVLICRHLSGNFWGHKLWPLTFLLYFYNAEVIMHIARVKHKAMFFIVFIWVLIQLFTVCLV